jgi:hypothetical protein
MRFALYIQLMLCRNALSDCACTRIKLNVARWRYQDWNEQCTMTLMRIAARQFTSPSSVRAAVLVIEVCPAG